MNSQTLNVAISRNCKKRYHGCKEDHWRVPSKFFLPTIHLFLDFKCVELYGMSFDSEYYSVFTIIESLIRERFYYSFLFVIGRGLEYHRYQWKKWKAKSSVLNYTFYSFYMITSLSSKNAMICRHGQWTNSLLPKFACLNMFHPNPKIVGKLGLFWPLWSSAFVHIYCYGLVQSSKINYWCHEKNVLNFSTLT